MIDSIRFIISNQRLSGFKSKKLEPISQSNYLILFIIKQKQLEKYQQMTMKKGALIYKQDLSF